MIEVTFLGTVSGVPTRDRNHSAIVMSYCGEKKETVLMDCGEGTQRQMLIAGINFMNIDKIFITHWHADHFAGLIPLIQTMNLERRQRPLHIFAPEAERFVADILDLGYFGLRFEVEAVDLPFEGDEIHKIFEEEEYEMWSVPTKHTVPSVAFLMKGKDRWNIDPVKVRDLGLRPGPWMRILKEKGKVEHVGRIVRLEDVASVSPGPRVVYSGDTMPCKTVEKIAEGADLLIHDGTFLESEESGGKHHTDVSQAANLAKAAGVKQLILTHVSRRYHDTKPLETEARKFFKNTKIAHDFMKVFVE
jgi:ribonuclease Z